MSFLQQSLCGFGTQGIGDEQVAICVPEVELLGSEAVAEVGCWWWRDARGHCGCWFASAESCATEGTKGDGGAARARSQCVKMKMQWSMVA